MRNRGVVLGFSGGIDSITAARGLLSDGYDVCAITLDMLGDKQMIDTAISTAREVGVSHLVCNVQKEFQDSIITYFARSYMAGETPAPCTICNSIIKWHHLERQADKLHYESIATGHYFRIVRENNHYYVARAADSAKDQSYYLWGLSQSLLARVLTPMGDVIKADVKQGFANKGESMGLCFLRGRSYREYMMQHYPSACKKGDIVDTCGRIVGQHDGVAFYTIGQKRGLDVEGAMRCIVAIDASANKIVVGTGDDLYHLTLEIEQCNIVDIEEITSADDISVIIRGIGRNPQGYARRIEPTAQGFRIELEHPAWAAAIGQPVVLYRGCRVVGGGILRRYY